MSMSDAYQRCEELGIPTDTPDALDRLWDALTVDQRHEVFPFANDDGSPRTEPWPRPAPSPLPVGAGGGPVVVVPPIRGRMPWPPTPTTARARQLAAEHLIRANHAATDKSMRLAVAREAADTLAKLAAVYLGADSDHASSRNLAEARAYALAFRLVEGSARRVAARRLNIRRKK